MRSHHKERLDYHPLPKRDDLQGLASSVANDVATELVNAQARIAELEQEVARLKSQFGDATKLAVFSDWVVNADYRISPRYRNGGTWEGE